MESKESKYLRSLLNKFLITPIIKNSAYKEFFFNSKTIKKKSSFLSFHLIKWIRSARIYGQTPKQKVLFSCTTLGDASARFHS